MTPEEREYRAALDSLNKTLADIAERERPREKPQPQIATLTIPLTIGLLMRKVANQVVYEAQRSGFTVQHHHDGGWLEREHTIVVEGEAGAVSQFEKTLKSWLQRIEQELGAK